MINWWEPLPGFWLPRSWTYEKDRWPDYTADYVEARLASMPEVTDVLKFRGYGEVSGRAWGAWNGSYNNDKPLKRGWPELERIADKLYDKARYIYLVPAWRRAIVNLLGELDDAEDQLSTILWVAETVSKKWIPLPKSLMNRADQLRKTLDCSEKVLAGITPFRGSKAEYGNCLKEIAKQKEAKQRQRAGLIAWFQDNWGRLLEAAQATNQWFDIGIVLGPIMGFIEEGLYGLAYKTVDNYLVAVDAYMPGYREDFHRNARELSDSVERTLAPLFAPVNYEAIDQQGANIAHGGGAVGGTIYDIFGFERPAPKDPNATPPPPTWMDELLFVAP